MAVEFRRKSEMNALRPCIARFGQRTEQVSLFDLMNDDQQKKKREKQDKLEAAVYALRQKKGSDTITLGFQKNDDIGIHRKK